MTLTTSFSVRAPIAVTWRALLDVPGIVHCLPGVELTEVISERIFAGKVELQVGPLRLSYSGVVEIEQAEEQSHSVRMTARGARNTGGKGGSATVRARLLEEAGRTTVVMNADIAETGILTRFGPRTMAQVAARRMSERFANCLERRLGALPA